jgi:Putative DNA-binding domain
MPSDPSTAWESAARAFSGALLAPNRARPGFLAADDKRFDVYRNNVTVGLIRALEANFPGLRTLLGVDFFCALARDFVRAHPPKSRLLFDYGAELPDFISGAGQLTAYPYLADVARFEHLWLQSFHEADATPLTGEELQQAFVEVADRIRLRAHPATRFLSSDFAVQAIATASRAGQGLGGIDPAEAECCVLTRPALTVASSAVPRGEFKFMQLLAEGHCLIDAADMTAAIAPGFDLNRAMATMLKLGAFVAMPQHDQKDRA